MQEEILKVYEMCIRDSFRTIRSNAHSHDQTRYRYDSGRNNYCWNSTDSDLSAHELWSALRYYIKNGAASAAPLILINL